MKSVFLKKQYALVYTSILVVIVAIVIFTPVGSYLFEPVVQKSLSQKKEAKQKHGISLLETLFLPTIKERLKKDGVTDLNEEDMPDGVKEVRIWVGFSLNGFRGVALRQDSSGWAATYFPPLDKETSLSSSPRSLSSPKHGWQKLSQDLHEFGLYTFTGEPDRIPGKSLPTDSISTVVEIKSASSYRAYSYYGLLYDEANEIKKMEAIIELLSSEFDIKLWGNN